MFSGLEHSEESPRAKVPGACSLGPNPPNPRTRIASGAGRKMAHIVKWRESAWSVWPSVRHRPWRHLQFPLPLPPAGVM